MLRSLAPHARPHARPNARRRSSRRGPLLAVAVVVAVVLGALLAPAELFAQRAQRVERVERPAADREPLRFERIAQDAGLSHGTVTAVLQDRTGFLWFGTEDGLDRYAGDGFTVFRPAPHDTAALADGWISGLAEGPDGTLWVATLHGGVARYLPALDRFRSYRHADADPRSLGSDRANAVLPVADGAVWVGTVRGLDRLDPATGQVQHHPLRPADSMALANDVLALAPADAGHLWVGGRTGLFLFDVARGTFAPVGDARPWFPVRAIRRDRRGIDWVATENALVAVDPAARRVVARYEQPAPGRPSPIGGRVLALELAPDGTLWVGSDNGLTALDPATGRYRRHTHRRDDPHGLGGEIVRSVLVDRGGVLWAGLESYGISKYAPAAVHFDVLRHDLADPRSLSDGYVRGISEDRRGDLWIATQYGGLDRRDARTGRITAFRHQADDPRSLPNDNVWALYEDHAGTAWVGLHYGGLGTFDRSTGAFTRSPLVPHDASVNLIVEDRAGRLLVGIEGGGLVEISADRRRARTYGATRGDVRVLVNDDVQTVLEDRDGWLWVGGVDGLTRLDRRTGRALHFRGVPGEAGALGTDFVTDVFEARDGTIWVATKGAGLARYDARTGRFTSVGEAEGLPHRFVYGILEDAHGRLWLSTEDGLASYAPRTGAVTRFGLGAGLQGREFNRRAFHRGSDGTMYFGGTNGVNFFRPDAFAPAPPPPPVTIVALQPAGALPHRLVGRPADAPVVLPAGTTGFTLSYAALEYTAPEQLRFAYRLDGVDRAWVEADGRRAATYAGLRPGRYVFRVAAANAAGVWNRDGARVTVVVAGPWYTTWWARLTMLGALVGVVWGFTLLRLHAADRRAEARLRGAVEASLDALVVFDARHAAGRVAFAAAVCNERAAACAGLARDAVRGRAPEELFPGAVAHGLTDACVSVAAGGESRTLEYEDRGWTRLQVVRVGDGVAITARDVTAEKTAEAELRELALVDELTGVYNRRGFLAMAEREWSRAAHEGHGALLVYLDVNDFKAINDTNGHAEGDQALRTLADVLRATFRGADVIGRLGGDEFAVLVVPTGPGGARISAADARSELDAVEPQIRTRLARHLAASNAAARAAGRPYDVSVGLGVVRSGWPAGDGADALGGCSLDALMRAADARLYEDKRRRRSRSATAA